MSCNRNRCDELQRLIEKVEKALEDLENLEKDVESNTFYCNNEKIVGTLILAAGALKMCATVAASVFSLDPNFLYSVRAFVGGMVINVSAEYIRDTRDRFVSPNFLIFHCHAISMCPQLFLLSYKNLAFVALRLSSSFFWYSYWMWLGLPYLNVL